MKKYIISLIASTFVITGYANNSIDDIIGEVAINNLELKASEANTLSEGLSIKATNNLKDPTIDMEYLFGNKGLGNKLAIGVSQSFDWPGIYGVRSNLNKSRINALSYIYKMKRLEILLQAKHICIDIINVNKQIAVQNEIHENVTKLFNEYNKGFNHGEISILDINKLKIELLASTQKLNDYTTQLKVLTESLRAINGNVEITSSFTNLSNYPLENLKSIDSYIQNIQVNDPEMNYYLTSIDANKAEIKASKMGWFPGISVGYKYSNELGDKFNGFTFGINIPLFSNRHKVNAAKAKYVADNYSKQNIVVSKEIKAKSEYNQLLSLNSQINAYKSILNGSDNIDALNKALNGGQITLLNYLMELRYFIEAKSKLLEMEYTFNQTLANIDRYSLLNK
ncbi:MAG: TolC family protein [Muribaculaceae bacterium]